MAKDLSNLVGAIVVIIILYLFYININSQAFGVYTSGATQRYMGELTGTNQRPGISGTMVEKFQKHRFNI
jgi:hypothetical protein